MADATTQYVEIVALDEAIAVSTYIWHPLMCSSHIDEGGWKPGSRQ